MIIFGNLQTLSFLMSEFDGISMILRNNLFLEICLNGK